MNQAEVSKLVSQLKCKVNPRLRKFRNPKGPEERLNKLRKTVTALVKHERLELNYPRAEESRMYAERLISDAIRYGDCHRTTMDMASYWLVEKQLVHKLFKVLVPRYQNYNVAFTRIFRAPRPYPGEKHFKAVLELRGNPFPPLVPDQNSNRSHIQNVLMDEARKEYRAKKYAEIAAKIEAAAENLHIEDASTTKIEEATETKHIEDEATAAVENLHLDDSVTTKTEAAVENLQVDEVTTVKKESTTAKKDA